MKFAQSFHLASVAARNLLLGGNLISLALIRNPKMMLQYISETLFLYKTFAAKRGIPQILKPRQVFEIGTLTGYTAFHFALNSPDDAKIYTLDLPMGEKIAPQLKTTMVDGTHIESHLGQRQYAFDNTAVAEKITCLFGDSAAFDFSPFHNQIDLFFIDGAHSYEYVRSDTLNALRCCHPGSVIAWHDFGRVGVNGVSKWILEFARTHQVYCVPGSSLAFMRVPDKT